MLEDFYYTGIEWEVPRRSFSPARVSFTGRHFHVEVAGAGRSLPLLELEGKASLGDSDRNAVFVSREAEHEYKVRLVLFIEQGSGFFAKLRALQGCAVEALSIMGPRGMKLSKPRSRGRVAPAVSLVAGFLAAPSSATEEEEGVLADDGPSPAQASGMVGDWTGLVPGRDILLTLRVNPDQKHGVIAITERKGDRIVTRIDSLVGLHVEWGRFSMWSRDRVVEIVGYVQRDLGALGEGYAFVTIRDPGEELSVLKVNLFLWAGESWVQKMLDLEAKAKAHE